MTRSLILTACTAAILHFGLTQNMADEKPDPKIPSIKAVQKVQPNPSVFKAAKRMKPLVIRSREDASKHFSKKALDALTKQVNFKQQFVLIFAWRGSGQDKLTYNVAESYPEQIRFIHKRGRTRDLRPHVKVFALRSNVKWSAK